MGVREDHVNQALTEDPLLDAANVEVGVEGREIVFNGSVGGRYAKQSNVRIVETSLADLHTRAATTDAPDLTERMIVMPFRRHRSRIKGVGSCVSHRISKAFAARRARETAPDGCGRRSHA